MMKKVLFLLLAVGCLTVSAGRVFLTVADSTRQLVSDNPGIQTLSVKAEADSFDFFLRARFVRYGQTAPRIWSNFVKAAPETKLTVDLKEPGYYAVTIYAYRDRQGKEPLAEVHTNYALLPKPLQPERPAEFGVCTHFGQQSKGAFPLTFELMKLANVSRIRDDVFWNGFERKPGVYTPSERLEKAVDTALEYGIRPLLVIGYNNEVAYPGKFKGPFPVSDEMRDAFAKAVGAAVRHFGGRVTEWEIWNEPKPSVHPVREYLPLLKAVYPAAKAANPDAVVISCGGGGAGGGPGGGMILPIVQNGGADFQDAFSIHPYMSPYAPETGYEAKQSPIPRVNVPVVAKHMRSICDGNPKSDGSKLRPYITEIGWYVEHPAVRARAATPMWQAACAARLWLAVRRENTYAGVFWYDFQDDGADPAEREHNFGLIRADYSPKPAYQATAVVTGLLGNLPFSRTLRDDDCRIYLYGESLVTAFTLKDTPETVIFTPPFPAEHAKLLNWDGSPGKWKVLENNRVETTLTYLPVYLVRSTK